jgi:hypothetical protein
VTAPAPERAATEQAADDLTHSVCHCDPDRALCGTNVTDSEWADDDEELTCVVCLDLVDQPCPRCGQ